MVTRLQTRSSIALLGLLQRLVIACLLLLLGEFVASGAYRTRRFAEFKQARNRKKGG